MDRYDPGPLTSLPDLEGDYSDYRVSVLQAAELSDEDQIEALKEIHRTANSRAIGIVLIGPMHPA